MRVQGNVDLAGNELRNFVLEPLLDFPVDAKVGRTFFKTDNGQIYVCVSEVPVVWNPVGSGAGFVYNQATADTIWMVNHNLGSTDVFVQLYDAAGNVIMADVNVIDANTLSVFVSVPLTGKVLVSKIVPAHVVTSGSPGIGVASIGTTFIIA